MAESELVRWHPRLNGHGFSQTLGDSGGHGSLACCSSWDCKESDVTDGLNSSSITHSQEEFESQ